MVKNRDQWTITAIHPDRSITVTGRTGTVRLPTEYVANEIRLGYAQTSHTAQGRTVDTALLLIDTPTDHAGIYTPLTRGREANHAYVITEGNQTAIDVLNKAISRDWIDRPAHTHIEPVDELALRFWSNAEELEYLRAHMKRSSERRELEERTWGRGLSL